MNKKTKMTNRFHSLIRTTHVFIEDEQVFMKKETKEEFLEDTAVAEWFPTDFKWIPARV